MPFVYKMREMIKHKMAVGWVECSGKLVSM